jgi:DNA polymerase III epsilon subunit-like protein
MRHIVIDTETTGLDPLNGDRIVEIGAVELINRAPTGQTSITTCARSALSQPRLSRCMACRRSSRPTSHYLLP